MKKFKLGQRVTVVAADLKGKTGTVVRLRIADDAAWVRMDDELPEHLRSFSKGDSRYTHIVLFPQECKPLEEQP